MEKEVMRKVLSTQKLLIYGNVQRFIENKKYSLKSKVEDVIRKAVQEQDLYIGSAKLEVEEYLSEYIFRKIFYLNLDKVWQSG